MMRLQPLTGALSEPAAAAPVASGATGGFDTALASSVARQDVPSVGGTFVPGGGSLYPTPVARPAATLPGPSVESGPAGALATAMGTSAVSRTASPSLPASSSGAIDDQSAKDDGLLSPSRAIPAPLQVGASIAVGAAMGNPLGVVETVFMGLVGELARMGPDLSRPAVPAGMSQTHSKAGMQPVSPGTLGKGEYLTLATTVPAFLANGSTPRPSAVATETGGASADDGSSTPPSVSLVGLMSHYAAMDAYQRRQALERGIY